MSNIIHGMLSINYEKYNVPSQAEMHCLSELSAALFINLMPFKRSAIRRFATTIKNQILHSFDSINHKKICLNGIDY